MKLRRISLALLIGSFLASIAAAQNFPAQPPAPAKYKATIRYRIAAPRDTHVALYDDMIEHLKKLNFEFDPPLDQRPRTDREDRGKSLMVGLVPARNALKISQNTSVAGLLLVPEELKIDDPNSLVQIRLELAGDLSTEMHRELGNQIRPLLAQLGFLESTGYDHRGHSGRPFTRLVGAIQAGKVDLLVKDLRNYPTDWFTKVFDLNDFPLPLRRQSPIRMVEVLNDAAPTLEPLPAPGRDGVNLDKIAPDLWQLVDKEADRVARVQIFLIAGVPADEKELRFSLRAAAPTLSIEGHLGSVVSGSVEARQVRDLAQHPRVSAIRLARPNFIQSAGPVAGEADNARALKQSGIAELHGRGFRGKGVRLGLIDTDFRGWKEMVQAGKLPRSTRLVDLTTERNPELYPAPYLDKIEVGHGTQCALAAALSAPEADFVLIRIDAFDPYQLYEIVRYVRGTGFSEMLTRRQEDVYSHREMLRLERDNLLARRRVILDNFRDETDELNNFGFLGPVYGWVFSDRYWLYQQMAHMEKLEKTWSERYGRYLQLVDEVKSLQGIQIVVSPFAWPDGFPAGGASPLSRWFNDQSGVKPLWIQAAGNTRGQSWTGLCHDVDGNGLLEFAPLRGKLPKDRWTPELNFLGFARRDGLTVAELPAPSVVRLSFQWREPHDPDYFTRGDDDPYRRPIAPVRLTLLRQRDPQAKKLPADVFEVAGRSQGYPQRLEHQPGFSIFEQVLEVPLRDAGRYAVLIERQLDKAWILVQDAKKPRLEQLRELTSTGIRPVGAATLPELEKKWEMKARLFVDFLDEATRGQGRAVLLDFVTDQGSIGLPADARNVISVGAMNLEGKPQPYSAQGPPAFLDLLQKPDLHTYDGLRVVPEKQTRAFGTSLAAPFAAGGAACQISAGMTPEQVAARLRK